MKTRQCVIYARIQWSRRYRTNVNARNKISAWLLTTNDKYFYIFISYGRAITFKLLGWRKHRIQKINWIERKQLIRLWCILVFMKRRIPICTHSTIFQYIFGSAIYFYILQFYIVISKGENVQRIHIRNSDIVSIICLPYVCLIWFCFILASLSLIGIFSCMHDFVAVVRPKSLVRPPNRRKIDTREVHTTIFTRARFHITKIGLVFRCFALIPQPCLFQSDCIVYANKVVPQQWT